MAKLIRPGTRAAIAQPVQVISIWTVSRAAFAIKGFATIEVRNIAHVTGMYLIRTEHEKGADAPCCRTWFRAIGGSETFHDRKKYARGSWPRRTESRAREPDQLRPEHRRAQASAFRRDE